MIARFFIERPVLANVLALLILVVGAVAVLGLPVAQGAEIEHNSQRLTATPLTPGVAGADQLPTAPAVANQFGWQPETKDMGEAGLYRVQMLGGKQAGGMMRHPMPGAPSCWVVYFFVEDLAVATKKGKQLGAVAMMESVPIPEVGAFSMLTDPTGAMFALFQPNMTGKPC